MKVLFTIHIEITPDQIIRLLFKANLLINFASNEWIEVELTIIQHLAIENTKFPSMLYRSLFVNRLNGLNCSCGH